jgi:hypothetical protein
MSANAPRTIGRIAGLISVAVIGVGLGGCDDDELRFRYRAHSDKVTRGAGNAAAANIAIQTINPWPESSRRTRIDQDGKRAHIAIKRYETNTSITPRGLTTTNGFSNGLSPLPLAGAQK